MELRALLCWASLVAALEGEFPWSHPATSGVPRRWASGWKGRHLSPPNPAPQQRTLRTNSASPGGGRGGGGPAGSGVFFCLGKRWRRALSRDMPRSRLPTLFLRTPDALGSLSFYLQFSTPIFKTLSKVSVLSSHLCQTGGNISGGTRRQGRTLC